MRYFLLFSAIIVIMFLALNCTEQEKINGVDDDGPILGTIACKIDSMDWTGDRTSYARLTNSGRTLTVYGSSDLYAVGFKIDSFAFGAGTYYNSPSKPFSFIGLYSPDPNDTSKTQRSKKNSMVDTGMVAIESMTVDGIKGRFYFRISIPNQKSVAITSGKFNLNFTSK